MSACTVPQRILAAAFGGSRLSARKVATLSAHLQACDSCRSLYDRAALVGRAAAEQTGTSAALAPWRMDFIETQVLSAVPRDGVASRRPAWLFATAAAAVALLVVPFFLADEPGSRPREAGAPAISIRALCGLLDSSGNLLVRSWAADPSPQEVEVCPVDGVMRLAYTATAPGLAYVAVIASGGTPMWYHDTNRPLAVKPADELALLPVRFDMTRWAGADAIELVVILAAEPLADAELSGILVAPQLPRPSVIGVHRQILQLAPSANRRGTK